MHRVSQSAENSQLLPHEQRYLLHENAKQIAQGDKKIEVIMEAQGHLFRTHVLSIPRNTTNSSSTSKRGRITEFSRRSRKRLLEKFARMEHDPQRTSFVTLTYPKWFADPGRAKEHLEAFRKRLKRRYGSLPAVWRIEPQKRGAPHFHIILFDAPFIPKDVIARQWAEVIGQPEAEPWTRIEKLRSWRGVMSYAAKYIAKAHGPDADRDPGGPYRGQPGPGAAWDVPTDWFVPRLDPQVNDLISESGPLPCTRGLDYVPYLAVTFLYWGRWWGVWNEGLLPYADLISVRLPFGNWFYDLKRCGRHVWERVNGLRWAGFTLFRDNPKDWFSLGTMFCVQSMGMV